MQNQNSKLKSDLRARAYRYSISMVEFLDDLSLSADRSSQVIVGQLLRSATSIGANIIEAQAASSKKDFVNYFHHSLKSANESLYWLGLLKDAKKISNTRIENLLQETNELANILGASLLTMKGKRNF